MSLSENIYDLLLSTTLTPAILHEAKSIDDIAAIHTLHHLLPPLHIYTTPSPLPTAHNNPIP
jgi:hypothetical protein